MPNKHPHRASTTHARIVERARRDAALIDALSETERAVIWEIGLRKFASCRKWRPSYLRALRALHPSPTASPSLTPAE